MTVTTHSQVTTRALERPSAAHIGRMLDGRYVIEECIGEGGFGWVYTARQEALGREVVIKVLNPNLTDDPERLARFEREAREHSKLLHPNIVTVFDFGHHHDLSFLVMERVDGVPLSALLHEQGPLDYATFKTLALQMLDALAYVHEQGILHRDLKPSNMMVFEEDGVSRLKLLDFGLVKPLAHDSEELTGEQLIGSASYISPEAILGEEVGPATDVYSLGVIFFLMLTGEKPFVADNPMTLLAKHIKVEPRAIAPLLPAGVLVPDRIVLLIERCLAKDPSSRSEDGAALRDAFLRAIMLGADLESSLDVTEASGAFIINEVIEGLGGVVSEVLGETTSEVEPIDAGEVAVEEPERVAAPVLERPSVEPTQPVQATRRSWQRVERAVMSAVAVLAVTLCVVLAYAISVRDGAPAEDAPAGEGRVDIAPVEDEAPAATPEPAPAPGPERVTVEDAYVLVALEIAGHDVSRAAVRAASSAERTAKKRAAPKWRRKRPKRRRIRLEVMAPSKQER